MALTTEQMTTLAAAIRAEADQTVVDALAVRNDVALRDWLNGASTTDAWMSNVSSTTIIRFIMQQLDVYDGMTAGKRDAVAMARIAAMNGEFDARNADYRNGYVTSWASGQRAAAAASITEKARRGELYFSTSDATQNTVTAKVRTVVGPFSLDDVSNALNANP